MTAIIWTVIAAVFQIVLLTLQQWSARTAAKNKAKAAQSKEITDAIASGDVSRINSAVQQLRR